MRRGLTVLSLLVLTLTGCGTGDSEPGTGSASETTAGGAALRWGSGDQGVVLAHGAAFDAASWEEQAVAIAEQGATVLAVEDISPDGIRAAVETLTDEGLDEVALVGGSAGADAILELSSEEPDLSSQLVLISPNTVETLEGEQPKLFIASEDESVAEVSTELADTAAGEDNVAELLPGSAHAQNIFDTDQGDVLLELILERLAS